MKIERERCDMHGSFNFGVKIRILSQRKNTLSDGADVFPPNRVILPKMHQYGGVNRKQKIHIQLVGNHQRYHRSTKSCIDAIERAFISQNRIHIEFGMRFQTTVCAFRRLDAQQMVSPEISYGIGMFTYIMRMERV